MVAVKHKLGQYFTTNVKLKKKVYEFILNSPSIILEPSIGQGDLVEFVQNNNDSVKFDMYEIDESIKLLDGIDRNAVIYTDFMEQSIDIKYKTIIGNPPYMKTSRGNLYINFIEKCYKLLDDVGELIFIVPSDFFKLTSASSLLIDMLKSGTFTHVYHPNNEKMFDGASIDIIVFRYCLDESIEKVTQYNGEFRYLINSNGMVTFNEEVLCEGSLFSDCFDIHVGMVSGMEKIYKNEELGNISVINGKEKTDKYIYIEKFPCGDDPINDYLSAHKNELMLRKIKKYNEDNWFSWGAPRNISVIKSNRGENCIYISMVTRKKDISFLGTVDYFGGSLIMIRPKKKYNLELVVSYLNSDLFQTNFIFSGRFKIGHRQLSNTMIPHKYLELSDL